MNLEVAKQCASFGPRLKAMRLARGWSQEDAALELGFNRCHWQHWESGKKSPTEESLNRLAAGFGISVDELTRGGQ